MNMVNYKQIDSLKKEMVDTIFEIVIKMYVPKALLKHHLLSKMIVLFNY